MSCHNLLPKRGTQVVQFYILGPPYLTIIVSLHDYKQNKAMHKQALLSG